MLNAQMLKLKGACAVQLELFELIFPDGADLTVENALSVAFKFDWIWAAENLFTPENLDAYKVALKSALDVRDATLKPALDTYNANVKFANDAWDVYEVILNAARSAYNTAKARTFAEMYIRQEQKR